MVTPDLLHFLLLSLAGYWAVQPQVARMITGDSTDDEAGHDRRRAAIVDAANRLMSVSEAPASSVGAEPHDAALGGATVSLTLVTGSAK